MTVIINAAIVREMRRMRSEGHSIRDISTKFGVTREPTRQAIVQFTWKHVVTPYDKFVRENPNYYQVRQSKMGPITAKNVQKLFTYDPDEGILRWRVSGRGIPQGHQAGVLRKGYLSFVYLKKLYATHLVIYLYMKGRWCPKEFLDHKDGDGLNNKWLNLRPATRSQNLMNSKLVGKKNASGRKGVYRFGNGFRASITKNKRQIYLGYFKTFEEAVAARHAAEQEYHGEFARAQ